MLFCTATSNNQPPRPKVSHGCMLYQYLLHPLAPCLMLIKRWFSSIWRCGGVAVYSTPQVPIGTFPIGIPLQISSTNCAGFLIDRKKMCDQSTPVFLHGKSSLTLPLSQSRRRVGLERIQCKGEAAGQASILKRTFGVDHFERDRVEEPFAHKVMADTSPGCSHPFLCM